MRKGICIFIAILLLLVAVDVYRSMGSFDTITYRVWKAHSRYSRVRNGMTERQVESLLGRPDRIVPNMVCEWWSYPVQQPTGKEEPSMSYVNYGPNDRVTSVVPQVGASIKRYWPKGQPKPGMTKHQVQSMLGKPSYVKKNEGVAIWKYHVWNRSTFLIWFGRDGRVCRV